MCKYSAFKGAPNSNCKTREVQGDASFLSLKFHVLLALFSQLSVFLKLYIVNTLLQGPSLPENFGYTNFV